MTGAFGIRLSRANERIRNAKKHIIQILDSSHVARRANGREKKEFLFRFRLLFAMANCVRVMRKRRAHTHTPDSQNTGQWLFRIRISQWNRQRRVCAMRWRCHCEFVVAELTTKKKNGRKKYVWGHSSRFSARSQSCVHVCVRVCLQINFIYAANICLVVSTSTRLPLFQRTGPHTIGECVHSMDDGIVIEYLFRIIHQHDILFRCVVGGGGGDGSYFDCQ